METCKSLHLPLKRGLDKATIGFLKRQVESFVLALFLSLFSLSSVAPGADFTTLGVDMLVHINATCAVMNTLSFPWFLFYSSVENILVLVTVCVKNLVIELICYCNSDYYNYMMLLLDWQIGRCHW